VAISSAIVDKRRKELISEAGAARTFLSSQQAPACAPRNGSRSSAEISIYLASSSTSVASGHRHAS
jgi:hypothetical protein